MREAVIIIIIPLSNVHRYDFGCMSCGFVEEYIFLLYIYFNYYFAKYDLV